MSRIKCENKSFLLYSQRNFRPKMKTLKNSNKIFNKTVTSNSIDNTWLILHLETITMQQLNFIVSSLEKISMKFRNQKLHLFTRINYSPILQYWVNTVMIPVNIQKDTSLLCKKIYIRKWTVYSRNLDISQIFKDFLHFFLIC